MRCFFSVLILTVCIPLTSLIADENHKGKTLLGPRLALGGVYGASVGVAFQGEYVLADNFVDTGDVDNWFGVGGVFAYSTYSERFGFLGSFSEWEYTNIVFLGSAFFHFDFIKDPRWDTYSTVSLGINTGSVSLRDDNGFNGSSPSVSGFVFGLGIGARFAFNEKVAAAAEAGFGVGALRLGVDFKL